MPNNHIRSAFLLTAMTLVLLAFGLLLGGDQGLKAAIIPALVMNLGAWWFSADLVLAQTGARLVSPETAPELHALTAHLAERAGLPMPRLAVVDDPAPNAFATGRNPGHAVVAVTTGLLNLMNREELAGVLSHELTHVKNRDILVGSLAAVLAGAIMLLANLSMFFGRGRGRGGNPAAAIPLSILAPAAAPIIHAAISRSREYLADDGGADIAGTPDGLASALAKLGNWQGQARREVPGAAHLYIVSPLNMRSLSNLCATHPPLEERIARLRGEII
jgi:heat shock protein HtpX